MMKPSQAVTIAKLIRAAERYAANPLPARRLALEDAIAEAKKLPDPGCIYCSGVGEILMHAPDCQNDNCVMAGGVWDCTGQVGPCDCSVMDVLED